MQMLGISFLDFVETSRFVDFMTSNRIKTAMSTAVLLFHTSGNPNPCLTSLYFMILRCPIDGFNLASFSEDMLRSSWNRRNEIAGVVLSD